jgi:Rieske Fe-S protein
MASCWGRVTKPLTTRREFCEQACGAASAFGLTALIGSTLQGCAASPSGPDAPPASNVSGTVTGGTVTITIDPSSPLATVGNGALVQTSAGRFLLARTGPDSFSALTASCTHRSCVVTGFAGGHFVCPCHGSTFDLDGHVLLGPASRPLRRYATRFADGVLIITL